VKLVNEMANLTNQDFSVVICSVDRPKFLSETLNQFKFLTQFPYEVILVLGPGNEDFQLPCLPFDVKIIQISERNLSLARNIGLESSNTSWIVFLDDDAYPSSRWLADYVNGVESNVESYFFSGKVIDPKQLDFQYNGQITNSFGLSEEDSFSGSITNSNSCLFFRSPLGANFAVNKDVAISVGGFNNVLTWFLDETEFALRMNAAGYKLTELDQAIVEHWKSPSEIRDSSGRYISILQQWRSEGYVAGRYVLPILGAGVTERILLAKATTSIENILRSKRFRTLDKKTCLRLLEELELGLLSGYKAGSDSISKLISFEGGSETAKGQSIHSANPDKETAKKILLVYRSYLDDKEAGIAVWFKTLTEQLRKMNYFVEILCENPNKDSQLFEYIHSENLQLILTPGDADLVSAVSNIYPGFVQQFASSAYRYINKFQLFNPESFIVVPSFEGFGNLVLNSSRVITTLHTTSNTIENITASDVDRSQVRQDFSYLENFAIENSPNLLANTQVTSEYTQQFYGIDPDRIKMIYHGLDPLPEPVESVSIFSEFLYVGRLEPRKGLDLLLDIWEILASKSKDIRLNVAGLPVGSFGQRQIARIKSDFPNTVNYLGYVSSEKKLDLISRSSGVIIPSRYESFGLVALEAARQKRVSIGNSAGGLHEILNMGLGLSLNFNDSREVASEIEDLCSDRDRLVDLSQRAYATFNESFTSSRMAFDFENTYFR
jgi:glycogen(starch) synthase